MSLAMPVSQDNFIITTPDNAVTLFPMEMETYYKTGKFKANGEMFETDIKNSKSHTVTNRMIFLLTGVSIVPEILLVELKNRVTLDMDFD